MSTTQQAQKVTLYWLNHSRSQRILWLLEELKVQYELKVYKRDAGYRVPPELKKVHPLGKSPLLEVDGKVIGESGLIAQYLLQHFDTQKKISGANADEQLDIDYYLHYSEGSLQPLLVSILVLNVSKSRLPWPVKFIGSKVIDGIVSGFYNKELALHLDFLEGQLEGKKYFVGDKLTAADIILTFPLFSCFKGGRLTLEKSYPNLEKWVKLIDSNEVLQKCNDIAKEYD